MTGNLPPGAGGSSWATIDCECVNGHAWAAPAISELGGLFYVDDERGPFCPECRHVALDPDGQTFDVHELGEPMPGYQLDADWVWRMPDPAEPDLVDPPEGCDDDVDPSVAAQR